jgi:hypothetical protein
LNVGGSGSGSLVVGDSATNGMSFAAVSNLTANASSIEDAATAQVGMDNGHVTGTGTMDSGLGSAGSVTGVDTSDITVGEDAGTILASASSTLSATAATTGTNGFDSTDLPIVAEAVLGQTSDGLLDSSVTIGADGNVSGLSTLVGTATATNVGDGSGDDAYSTINLSGDGINNSGANGTGTITIGATGNVTGQSLLNADASSTTVSGTAEAKSLLDSTGVNLDVADADITIGESGNIFGLGVIGELSGGTSGSLSDQVDVLATAKLEDATALGKLTVAGISGTDGDGTADETTSSGEVGFQQTLLTAGPNGGNVTGQALGGANLVATTVGDPTETSATTDDATATLETSTLSGLADVDILGGMVGTNTIKGTSFGDFDVTADSIKGNAAGSSDVDAYGIIDNVGDGNITLSGNIEAIAQLTNTVTARTIEGNATATATGDAIGLGGYSINIIGSGAITASADSDSSSFARSVSGRAGA